MIQFLKKLFRKKPELSPEEILERDIRILERKLEIKNIMNTKFSGNSQQRRVKQRKLIRNLNKERQK